MLKGKAWEVVSSVGAGVAVLAIGGALGVWKDLGIHVADSDRRFGHLEDTVGAPEFVRQLAQAEVRLEQVGETAAQAKSNADKLEELEERLEAVESDTRSTRGGVEELLRRVPTRREPGSAPSPPEPISETEPSLDAEPPLLMTPAPPPEEIG